MDHKKQRKMMEDIQKGDLTKVKDKTTKTTDFNFCIDGGNFIEPYSLETPISAAVMKNDSLMMLWLMDNGAFLDYRVVYNYTDLRVIKINGRLLCIWLQSITRL